MKNLRILFILSAKPNRNQKNEDFYHRIYFLSRLGQLDVFAAKGADFSFIVGPGSKVLNAPWPGKLGMLLYSIFFFLFGSKSNKYNVIITEPSILTFCGFLGKIATKAKWVADVWDIPIRYHSAGLLVRRRCRFERALVRWMFRFADLFVVSIYPDMELTEFGIPKKKIYSINNAVWFDVLPKAPERKRPAGEPFEIFCMRSYHTEDMGLDTLAEAFMMLAKEHPDMRLVIVGKIPQKVESQVAGLRSMSQVKFHGFVDHEVLMQMIIETDICVIPFKNVVDLAQTYPLKVLEYLSLGKTVLASDIVGISTMIRDGVNGFLYKAGDAGDLKDKIEQLYADKELRRDIEKAAANLDNKYNVKYKNKKIFNRLRALLK